MTEQQLADEIVTRLIERGEHIWPGCKVVRRTDKPIPAKPEIAPGASRHQRANEE
jgi:hypothetical protein